MDSRIRSHSRLSVSAAARVPRSRTTIQLVASCAVLLAACSSAAELTESPLTTIAAQADADAPADSTARDNDDPETTAAPTVTVPAVAPLSGSLSVTVVDTHPHDSGAFTQGLEVFDGRFVESTGLYGESGRRMVDIASGEPVSVAPIDANLFGEGITVVGDELLQLTWKSGVLIRSNVNSLEETGRDTYEGEGWGLCFDGETVAMSDGSSTLTFRDAETFDVLRTIDVTLAGAAIERLNELECVNDQIIANVWLTDWIIVIDPATGNVVAEFDAAGLRPANAPFADSNFALNGIAHDPTTGHFYLTGKLWPVVYEVELS